MPCRPSTCPLLAHGPSTRSREKAARRAGRFFSVGRLGGAAGGLRQQQLPGGEPGLPGRWHFQACGMVGGVGGVGGLVSFGLVGRLPPFQGVSQLNTSTKGEACRVLTNSIAKGAAIIQGSLDFRLHLFGPKARSSLM